MRNDVSKNISGVKKADLVQRIRACFYVDAGCTRVNEDIIKELSQGAGENRPMNSNPSPSQQHQPAVGAFHLGNVPQQELFFPPHLFAGMQQPSIPGVVTASGAAAAAHYSMSTSQPHASSGVKRPYQHQHGSSSNHNSVGGGISPGNGRPDETPKNQYESRLLLSVMQMGLRDRREILVSIRKLADTRDIQEMTPTEVVCDVVAMREEAAEAAMMDVARRQSEEQNEMEIRRQRQFRDQELEERRRKATLSEWNTESDMFRDSWLLGESSLYSKLETVISERSTELKVKFIELLKLEQKARKWYEELPRAYFVHEVADRLAQSEELATDVQSEIDKLQKAMFSLTEQTGGTPRVMLEAHDRHRQEDNDIACVGRLEAPAPGSPRHRAH